MASKKEKALLQFLRDDKGLELTADDLEVTRYDDNIFEDIENGGEWMILTDDEADEMFDTYIESYIDDAMDIPDAIRPYFDEKKFARDVKISDGRGPSLSSWDGTEHDTKYKGTWYFIYQQNA